MRSIPTRMTARFGYRHPFTSAGMAFAGGTPDLALPVCTGGGIGAVGAGLTPAEQLRSIIRKVRAGTDAAFNVNLITCLDNDSRIPRLRRRKSARRFLHWGHPSPEHLRLLRDAGVSVWEQVGDVEAAKRAVDDGIEVVVAQGWEAGGHNYRVDHHGLGAPGSRCRVTRTGASRRRYRGRAGCCRSARFRCRRRLGRDAAGCDNRGSGSPRTHHVPIRRNLR